MSWKQRIATWLVGDPSKQVQELADLVMDAYRMGPALVTPEEMVHRLGEMDSQYLDLLIRTFIQHVPVGLGSDDTEAVRVRVIEESRRMMVSDVLTEHITGLWTDFGFGLRVDIAPRDKKAVKVWDEYWKATRNSPVLNPREIHTLSDDLLTDGEFFFVYFVSTLDGTSTVRTIPSEQIKGKITDPDDDKVVLYWKREWTPKGESAPRTRYYADWQASEEDLARANLPEGAKLGHDGRQNTVSVVQAVQHKKRNGRGWPLMKSAFPWSHAYKEFLEDRAAVAKAAASFLDKVKVKGGERALTAFMQKFASTLQTSDKGYETNPAPAAGSTWLENEAVERTRMSMSTGASDAEKDGGAILAQATLGGRVFPHWAGRGEAFRLATATQMETPVLRAFNRYQLFWSSVWSDMVKIVLTMAERYGSPRRKFKTYEADINTDAILQIDLQLVQTLMNALVELSDGGLIDVTAAQAAAHHLMRIALGTLGVANLDEVLGTPRKATDPPISPEPDKEPPESPEDEEEEGDLVEASGYDELGAGVRSYIYGLWSGQTSRGDFVAGMDRVIERRLTQRWLEGARQCGIQPDELTEAERTALTELITGQFQYVLALADEIEENNRESGGKLQPFLNRAPLWANRAQEAYNRGMTMACQDEKLKWVTHNPKPCGSCGRLNSKVKRASYWQERNIRPQAGPNPHLECEGWNCHCELVRTSDPVSRGPLPHLP